MWNKSSWFTLWPLYLFLYVLCFSLFVGPFLLLFWRLSRYALSGPGAFILLSAAWWHFWFLLLMVALYATVTQVAIGYLSEMFSALLHLVTLICELPSLVSVSTFPVSNEEICYTSFMFLWLPYLYSHECIYFFGSDALFWHQCEFLHILVSGLITGIGCCCVTLCLWKVFFFVPCSFSW